MGCTILFKHRVVAQYKLTEWLHFSTLRKAVMAKGILIVVVEDE